MSDNPNTAINHYLHEYFRRRSEAIEAACEEAIQGGEHGVLLVRYPNCVGCGQPAATPRDLVCECCARLLEEEDRHV